MTDPYLIAHIVRGEPAFDIAVQIECPECFAEGCSQCDDEGFWWIIPTSGHRAYPYWYIALNEVPDLELLFVSAAPFDPRIYKPDNWPDHYPHSSSPKAQRIDLVSALGLRKPTQIKRRF